MFAKIYLTAKDTDYRLSQWQTLPFIPQVPRKWDDKNNTFDYDNVIVNPDVIFQRIEGFGGALTDAAAETWKKLPQDKQDEVIKAYYDPKDGIGYTLARTNIGPCDFSSEHKDPEDGYSYCDRYDYTLKSFSVQHDYDNGRIDLINAAFNAAYSDMKLFASPWSPPGWMKNTGKMCEGGRLLSSHYDTWADYMVKFVEAYEMMDIPIWALTVQNEPAAVVRWESCFYSPEEEGKLIKILGPKLKERGVKLFGWDHNRDSAYFHGSGLLSDPEVAENLNGIATHWYDSWPNCDQRIARYDNLRKLSETYPDHELLFSEGCAGPFSLVTAGDWTIGEQYAWAIINDINSGVIGWCDWNILLDEHGGPNHVGNYCFAPIHGDTVTGNLYYLNSYYYMGHFSKFVRPGSHRISVATTSVDFQVTAFMSPDEQTVVVVGLNAEKHSHKMKLHIYKHEINVELPPHSIATIVIEL